jgi:hypothetical protein
MTAVIPDQVPSELIAGDTWAFTREYGDYPAGTWTATIYLEFSGAQISQAATASGTTHSFSIAATTTAAKTAGHYRWWIRVTDGTTSTTVEDGWLDVKPDPAATGKRDHRSDARQMLDAINATLLGRATDGQLAMAINGRSISRIPLSELRDFRNELRQEVRTDEGGMNAGSSRIIPARLLRA